MEETLTPPQEQALLGVLRETDPATDEVVAQTDFLDGADTVGPVQHGPAHFVGMDFITDHWVLETELMIEYRRRSERQIALSRLWARLVRLVHPELRDRVLLRYEQRRIRAIFRISVIPVFRHEMAIRQLERIVNNRASHYDWRHPTGLEPPILTRQIAVEWLTSPRESEIGSTHGSPTEMDDLAAVMGRSIGLAQSARYNNVRTPHSSRGIDLGGGGGRGVRPWQSALLASAAVVAPPTPPSDTEYVVFRKGVPFGWFRGFVYAETDDVIYLDARTPSRHDQVTARYLSATPLGVTAVRGYAPRFVSRAGDDEGSVYKDVIQEGQMLEGYVNDGGAYVPSSKHTGRVAVFPFIRTEEVDEWLYMPALRKVLREFGACVPSEHNRRVAMNMLCRDYPTLPVEFKSAIIAMYTYVGNRLQDVVMGKPLRRFAPSAQVLSCINMFPVDAVVVPGVHRLEYNTCSLRPDLDALKRRDILVVTHENGGRIVDGQIEWVTQGVDTLKQVLVGARFRGEKDFAFYADNVSNQAAAMVRVYKCRGGTLLDDLRHSALQNTFIFDLYPCRDRRFQRDGRIRVNYGVVGSLQSVEYTVDKPVRRLNREESRHHSIIGELFTLVFAVYTVSYGFYELLGWCGKIITKPLHVVQSGMAYTRDRTQVDLAGWVSYPVMAMLWFIDVITLRLMYGFLDHTKKVIRKAVGTAMYGANTKAPKNFVGSIQAQTKDEPAKPGKPPRLYFNLGVLSAMFGGVFIEAAKKRLYGMRTVFYRTWSIHTQFVHENSHSCVSGMFRTAWEVFCRQDKEIYAMFMSDDVAVVTPDGFYELDISMCDASIGPGIFWLVRLFLESCGVPGYIIYGLLGQLTAPVTVTNPVNKKESIVWRFLTYYLVSGTVLTTLTDSIASLIVICAFVVAYVIHDIREPDGFVEYFTAVGLSVTVEKRERFEQLTMLKRRPLMSERGEILAPLAVATLFKRFGIISDLDKATKNMCGATVEERVAAFLGAVVDSWKSEPHHPLLDVMREVFPVTADVELPSSYTDDKRFDSKRNVERVSVNSLCESYGVSVDQYYQAVEVARQMRVGAYAKSSFMTRAFAVDYGL